MTEARSDRELVEAVSSAGDEAAFRELYRRHTPRLFRMAVRATGDRGGIAEDLVHDTWLRAAEGFDRFRWRSSLATWLGGILLNRVRAVVRSADWRRTDGEDRDQPEPAAGVSAEEILDLERALGALSPGHRTVLILHDIEGFTHDEIATMLGIASGTSKSQLFHARRRVRAWLAPGVQS